MPNLCHCLLLGVSLMIHQQDALFHILLLWVVTQSLAFKFATNMNKTFVNPRDRLRYLLPECLYDVRAAIKPKILLIHSLTWIHCLQREKSHKTANKWVICRSIRMSVSNVISLSLSPVISIQLSDNLYQSMGIIKRWCSSSREWADLKATLWPLKSVYGWFIGGNLLQPSE